jgi:ferredoxin-thioredoxin reductase catalytic chain
MSETEPAKPSQANIDKMWNYARKYAEKSGTSLHPDVSVTEAVVEGLARHIELVGRPLCPCNFYPDPQAEAKLRRWICACDEMQNWKYCHCLLFVAPDGQPITEYLPEDHEGRAAYGLVKDPHPDKGRATARVLERQKAEGVPMGRPSRPLMPESAVSNGLSGSFLVWKRCYGTRDASCPTGLTVPWRATRK